MTVFISPTFLPQLLSFSLQPTPAQSLSLFLSLFTCMSVCPCPSLSLPPSLPPSLLITLTRCLQMDDLDPTDELDEIALNALHQIRSEVTTGQHWLAHNM